MQVTRSNAETVACELHDRYDPDRAVALIGRTMTKALFAGRSGDVVFWALVHAHYRGDDTEAQVEPILWEIARILNDRRKVN